MALLSQIHTSSHPTRTFLEASPPPLPAQNQKTPPPPLPANQNAQKAQRTQQQPPPIPEETRIISISQQVMTKMIDGLGKVDKAKVRKSELIPLAAQYKALGAVLEGLAASAA